jgi:siderophore synthetase component
MEYSVKEGKAMNAQETFKQARTDFLAELSGNNAIGCLLNCYIREYANPRDEVTVNGTVADCPLALKQSLAQGNHLISIDFPESRTRILIGADIVSVLQRCRFVTKPYLKVLGKPWLPVQAEPLCRFMLKHLSLTLANGFNEEFLEQVRNSIEVTQAFLLRQGEKSLAGDSFIRSEQSLLWGHAMHPTPKSRQGVPLGALLNCSPETSSVFQLYWFEIDPSVIEYLGNKAFDLSCVSPGVTQEASNRASATLYPCHPWEVEKILGNPLVKKAIELGLIKPLGYQGQPWAPTSSVRTLYHPDSSLQMKLSIHVRLTNCVRKNAWYELESAVVLTELILGVGESIREDCPAFTVMPEPVATTVDLSSLAANTKLNHELLAESGRESFGILYRESISRADRESYQPALAASLFSWDSSGQSVIAESLKGVSARGGMSYDELATLWLTDYLAVLMPGLLRYFFDAGIVFEPHLQNTVIGFTDGMPSRIWIRDLEGAKLLPEKWPEHSLSKMSERAKSSVYYSREKGWQRIAYCLMINNISEAIFHLSAGNNDLESRLWDRLRLSLNEWQAQYGSQPELQGLLQGGAIPCKTNLVTRLLKQADKLSGYTLLPSPLSKSKELQESA